jgi:hypothetical protein
MANQVPVARRILLALDKDGREFTLTLGIGHPYEISHDEWACPVSLDGLQERLSDQHGVDSWQSLQLAYQLIAQLLGYFIEEGGKLFWPESRDPVALAELIPNLRK